MDTRKMLDIMAMVSFAIAIGFVVFVAFGGLKQGTQPTEDLNHDGEVNFQDFSIALYILNNIMEQLGGKAQCIDLCNQFEKLNVVEDVYPPVPLPYQN